ncbi:uncharacterized protein LOC131271190 isoform X2 [Anopheles coustani]|nr:uncharacterized protein LOC131271190 isoform X2 [Anopheles coustani]
MKAKTAHTSSPHVCGSDVLVESPSLMKSTLTGSMLSSPASSVVPCSNQHQKQQLTHSGYQLKNGSVDKTDLFVGSNNSTNSNNSSSTLHVYTPRSKKSPFGLETVINAHRPHQYQHCNNTITSTPRVGIEKFERCCSEVDSSSLIPGAYQKPMLIKADSIDILDCKKLERGISRATENVTLVSRARQEFEMDFHAHIHEQNDKNLNFIDTPDYTFTLPDLTKYRDDFRKFLEKDLIESSTLNSLEATNRLNWWYESGACRKLWPLATTGDGNCLLHAASLAMWGFHDRRLTLRRTLHDILSKEDFREALYRRWRFQQTRVNKQAGFVFCESEWAKEWEEIVAIASPEPRRNSKSTGPSRRRSLLIEKSFDAGALGPASICADDENAIYESLEEIHVLALAHILRRTIIVVSDVFLRDVNGEAFSPIPFGGVYLPFEVPSNECHRAPLLLAYDMAHFSALVAMETANDMPPALIPLVDATNQLLPIQFCIDPGKDFIWQEYDGSDGNWTLTDREHIALLKEYLDIVHATGIESPDDEIYYDDYSDDEYEKKIAEGEIVFTADENYNNNLTIVSTGASGTISSTPTLSSTMAKISITAPIVVPSSSVSGTVSSMTTSSQSLGATSGKDVGSKSKAAKQLQSVAKQFGSIGKSMSRKLRKNIGSITRIGSKQGGNAGGHSKKAAHDKNALRGEYPRFRIICAQLKSRRHEYQEEMIKNYLECAQERYSEAERLRDRKEMERMTKYVAEVGQTNHSSDYHDDIGCDRGVAELPEVYGNDLVNCINAGCLNYGTAATSYMCLECYEMQCKRESNCSSNINQSIPLTTDHALRYGTGKSKFYAEADMETHDRIQRLPSAKRLNDLDQTLYLSRSTFYNDTKLEDIPSGLAFRHVPSSVSAEQSPGIIGRQNCHVQPNYHHHHHHFHEDGGNGSVDNQRTNHTQQFFQPRTASINSPFASSSVTEQINSAKPPIVPSSESLASSSSTAVGTMYLSGGNGTYTGNNVNQIGNTQFNRASTLCVVNLPPISGSTSVNKCGELISLDTPYVPSTSGETSRAHNQPFSSSSSSSSLGGSSGLQSSPAIVNSSHYGKNQLCRTEGCKFYGSINTNFYCSKCCHEYNI